MSDLAAKLAALREHAADIASRIASFKEQRNGAALLAIFEAHKPSIAIIEQADSALDALTKEQQTISSALSQAESLLAQEHRDAETRERTALSVEAHKCAQAICALNAELDTLLAQLADTFEKRQLLLRELQRTEVADPTYVSKLASRSGPTRAACRVGLHRFIDMVAVSPNSHLSLASTNPQLLGIGLPPEKWPEPTPPLRPTKKRNGGG
jgi:hypothetical protein